MIGVVVNFLNVLTFATLDAEIVLSEKIRHSCTKDLFLVPVFLACSLDAAAHYLSYESE